MVDRGEYAAVTSEFLLPPVSSLGAATPEEVAALRAVPDWDARWAAIIPVAPVIEPSLRSINRLDDASRYKASRRPRSCCWAPKV
jgi:hypothetical protein